MRQRSKLSEWRDRSVGDVEMVELAATEMECMVVWNGYAIVGKWICNVSSWKMEPFYANSGVVQSWDGRRHICGVPDAGSRGSVPAVDMTKHKSPILFGIQSN